MQAQAVPVTLGLIPLLFCCHVLRFGGRGFWSFISASVHAAGLFVEEAGVGKQVWSHGFHLLQEFEVIAQIKLLQSACNNYSFTQEDQFVEWFHSLERLSEAER